MKNNWKKIEKWFKENVPEILETFNPPASEEELKKLEKVLGFKLPKDFINSYKIHNGQNTGSVFNSAILEPGSEGLSSIDEIIQTYKMYQSIDTQDLEVSENDVEEGIKVVYWNKNWLPILEDGMGNTYFIDLDPTEKGKVGQIIYRNHEGPKYELVAKSFKIWMKEFIQGNLE